MSSLERSLATLAGWIEAPLLLVIRVYWGWVLTKAGWDKLVDIEGAVKFFTSVGIPAPTLNAVLAGVAETVGGALLMLGAFTRPAAAVLIFVMLMAYATANRDALFAIVGEPAKFIRAAPFMCLFAATLVFTFGPGRWSVDAFVRKKS